MNDELIKWLLIPVDEETCIIRDAHDEANQFRFSVADVDDLQSGLEIARRMWSESLESYRVLSLALSPTGELIPEPSLPGNPSCGSVQQPESSDRRP